MGLIEEYGGTILTVAFGTVLGVIIAGNLLKLGDDKDIPGLKGAHDGFGG